MKWLARSLASPEEVDAYLRENWVIVPDPEGTEFVRAPEFQLCEAEGRDGRIHGDCDDAATLAAALLTVWNCPCWFVAVRLFNDPEFSHVFCRCFPFQVQNQYLDIDPIVPADRMPLQGVVEQMALEV